MKVHFHADHDHKWPSRAITAFKAGWSGTVKREVGERAISKGKATEVRDRAMGGADGKPSAHTNLRGSGGMAGSNHAPDVGSQFLNPPLDGAGQ